MDDAVLDLDLWEGGVDGCIKSRQIVCAGDEIILYAPVFQAVSTVVQNLALSFSPTHIPRTSFRPSRLTPMACTLLSSQPALRCGHDIVDGIQKYHGVDGLQRPLLPLFGDGQNLVRDSADRAVRDRNAVDVLNVSFNVAGGHTLAYMDRISPLCPD